MLGGRVDDIYPKQIDEWKESQSSYSGRELTYRHWRHLFPFHSLTSQRVFTTFLLSPNCFPSILLCILNHRRPSILLRNPHKKDTIISMRV